MCFLCPLVPGAVTGVLVEVTSTNSISVRWDPPIRYNGIPTSYTVRVYNILSNYSRELNFTLNLRRTGLGGLCK